jgi:hypothetical protein
LADHVVTVIARKMARSSSVNAIQETANRKPQQLHSARLFAVLPLLRTIVRNFDALMAAPSMRQY